jgi:predicted transcriptional regulator
LTSNGGTVIPTEITRWTLREWHNVTTPVNRLKRDGLVRTECDERQRSVNLILTGEVVNQVMLSIGEADALLQIITKVVRAFVDGG